MHPDDDEKAQEGWLGVRNARDLLEEALKLVSASRQLQGSQSLRQLALSLAVEKSRHLTEVLRALEQQLAEEGKVVKVESINPPRW